VMIRSAIYRANPELAENTKRRSQCLATHI
jgi:hypothetical protein